ncbi:MGH1-like glycoside hydrolase domain-containing protein [Vibrio ishigakensis]|uniref:MGH1-like glycoside hydrolase domain-containing protein n=1 Tax=Vibrio ishigakensis TaxID=1481914 RepID=UPI0021C4543F|nr:trehalase family glycosidase [Vibrio ishigakensis]
MPFIKKNQDLSLPDWGPYSKNYAGVAHVANNDRGLRFDVTVMPGHFRRQMIVPNEKWASAFHAWEASPNHEYYSYRYEIEWKDQVYCDVSVSAAGEDCRLIRCDYRNNTDVTQNLNLHLAANLNYPLMPTSMGDHDIEMQLVEPYLPTDAIYLDAVDYQELKFATMRRTDHNTEDGLKRAEFRGHNLVGGSGIGTGFGAEKGDWVSYQVDANDKSFSNAVALIRYSSQAAASFDLSGDLSGTVELTATDDEFALAELPLGALSSNLEFTLTSATEQEVVFDSIVVVEKEQVAQVSFPQEAKNYTPEIEYIGDYGVILKYEDSDNFYGITWKHDSCWLRQIFSSELDRSLRLFVPNTYQSIIQGDQQGHFLNAFMRPINVDSHTSKVIYSQVSSGNREKVLADINRFIQSNDEQLETVYHSARETRVRMNTMPSGETYEFSQERMAATEILNVVYPVYTRRQYIKHNTPGKWWDCLYTWDSGFIGMALMDYDVERAKETLRTYLTPEGDTHSAYISHGSPIPIQIYLLQEIWNKTGDLEFLKEVYGSVKQFYAYLAGHGEGSATNNLQSNILRTWDIFPWDTGGWDDYPAQHRVIHDESTDLRETVACSCNSAYTIRAARILKDIAKTLELDADVAAYDQDIELFSQALQEHAWDPKSQYFSYVLHNEEGKPTGHLHTDDGINYNMGMDGVMPVIAGVCDEEQQQLFLSRLKSSEHFWTPIGITLVDRQAPYYKPDGYCNGAVWMPHQWFFWKTALDLGDVELAHRIGRTALDLWKKEVETSYFCFEHFIVQSERGAGWHQFSGLTSPVVNWFNSYHVLGKLTTGFDTWVEKQEWDADYTKLDATIRVSANAKQSIVLVNLDERYEYQATWNQAPIEITKLDSGTLQVLLPSKAEAGELAIARA